LTEEFDASKLNGPIGISIIPGTYLALVTNSNYRLDYSTGALSVIDLNQNKIVSDLTFKLPNFSGEIALDVSRGKIVIPNRLNNSLLVLNYAMPGENGLPMVFSEPELSNSIAGYKNQIKMQDNPFGVVIAEPSGHTPKIYVTNIKSGDVNVLNAEDLSIIDADLLNNKSNGIPLKTMASLGGSDKNDGIGANRLALSSDERLVYVTSSLSNYIFIIDTFDDKIEGFIDASRYSSTAGMRGIVLDSSGKQLYVAHRGLGGVLVFDVSKVKDNGIDGELIDAPLIKFIPTGAGPEGITLKENVLEKKLYVCNEDESSLSVINLENLTLIKNLYTERAPTEMAIHPVTGIGYVTNFLSGSLSIIDTASDTVTGVIK